MCGIGGYVKKDGVIDNDDIELIEELSIMLERRGDDAYGFIAIESDGKVRRLFKIGAPASHVWEQLYDYMVDIMINAKAVLLHTRAATNGSPKENKNNHPFNIGQWYLAHNGFAYSYHYAGYGVIKYNVRVSNDEPETDSYQNLFKPMVEEIKKGASVKEAMEKVWSRVHGAIWLYDESDKQIYLFRGEKPIEYVDNDEVFMFASEGINGKQMSAGEFIVVDIKGNMLRDEMLNCIGYSYNVYGKRNKKVSQQQYDDEYIQEIVDDLRSMGYIVYRGHNYKWIVIDGNVRRYFKTDEGLVDFYYEKVIEERWWAW